MSAHLATQDPPPNLNLHFQSGPFTNKSAQLTLTTYQTPDCSTPSEEASSQPNPLTWNVRGTGRRLFYSYQLSRNLTAAEQLDFWSVPAYGGDVADGGCGPHVETSSPDSNGNLLRGAEDPGPARPCYAFLPSDDGTRPLSADGTPSPPSGYVSSSLSLLCLLFFFLSLPRSLDLYIGRCVGMSDAYLGGCWNRVRSLTHMMRMC